MESLFLPIFGLVLPFLALAIESIFPWGFLIEELLKAVLVFLIPKKSSNKILIAILIGLAFAATETVIYSTSILLTGGVGLFAKRFIATSILHSTTSAVMAISRLKNKNYFAIGVVLAIFIHYSYNTFLI